MLHNVPATSVVIQAYRSLPTSGSRPMTSEMRQILAKADKPMKGGKRKTKARPFEPVQAPKKKTVKQAACRPRTPTPSVEEDS